MTALPLAAFALVWLAALAGGELAQRLRAPAVTGELGAGLLLGWLARRGWLFFAPEADPALRALAGLGVILLMFTVGLGATVPEMLRAGAASLRVALAGVALPMAFTWGFARLALPGQPSAALFLSACLVATSVGVTARVLRERGALAGEAGRVILGAAVIDDVLGLLVLMGVSAAATGGDARGALAGRFALAIAFLAGALLVGPRLGRGLFRAASRLRADEWLLPVALCFCFALAWLGTRAGLAAIVGAYAAGLVLEPAGWTDLETREKRPLEELVRPLVAALAPLFFVATGAAVEIERLATPAVFAATLALAALAIAGKWLAGFAAGRGLSPSVTGWGMVPRGEVGLIFVAEGARLRNGAGDPLLSPEWQAALIGAILITTIAGPLGLSRALAREGKQSAH